jgi:hypothetical protein
VCIAGGQPRIGQIQGAEAPHANRAQPELLGLEATASDVTAHFFLGDAARLSGLSDPHKTEPPDRVVEQGAFHSPGIPKANCTTKCTYMQAETSIKPCFSTALAALLHATSAAKYSQGTYSEFGVGPWIDQLDEFIADRLPRLNARAQFWRNIGQSCRLIRA